MKLEGKVAVITGGEGALGRVVSQKFLKEGARLVIGWYDSKLWEQARAAIGGDFPGRFTDMQFDTSKEDQVRKLMQTARDKFGSLDILIHAVGMFYGGKMIWETDIKMLDTLYEVIVKGAFLCAKHAIPIMLEKRRGRIIFFPNALSLNPEPGMGVNAVAKSGLVTLTNVLREELKGTNITVNAVCPKVIDTPHTREMHFAVAEKGVKTSEIANLLSCICSDDCDALSGSVLKVFGQL